MHRRHHANRSAHASRTSPTRAHAPAHHQNLNTPPLPKGAKTAPPHGPIWASGGDWQSTAALALPARDKIAFQALPFANVGEDSEEAGGLGSHRDRAAALGIDLPQGPHIRRDGAAELLCGHLHREVALPLEEGTGEVISDTGWCFK